jgi:hypothetical protein
MFAKLHQLQHALALHPFPALLLLLLGHQRVLECKLLGSLGIHLRVGLLRLLLWGLLLILWRLRLVLDLRLALLWSCT